MKNYCRPTLTIYELINDIVTSSSALTPSDLDTCGKDPGFGNAFLGGVE